MLPLAAAILLAPVPQPRASRILTTPTYTVAIEELCPEYDVGCGKVRYRAVSRFGKSITLMGTQVMAMCGDGVTPCHPIGYRFRNKGVTYFAYENGELKVTRGSTTLADEQGKWNDH